jgi:hypothetical protein
MSPGNAARPRAVATSVFTAITTGSSAASAVRGASLARARRARSAAPSGFAPMSSAAFTAAFSPSRGTRAAAAAAAGAGSVATMVRADADAAEAPWK